MKVSVVCHGNVARSQVLHHYLAEYANRASVDIDLFSCGTAPIDIYPNVDRLLADVQTELNRRGLNSIVKRNILDEEALQHLADSDLILAADTERMHEVLLQLGRLGTRVKTGKVVLFYEFIGEGEKDFADTYDAGRGKQDPERFANSFDELERIAKLTIEQLQEENGCD